MSPHGDDGAFNLENVGKEDLKLILEIAQGELLEYLRLKFPAEVGGEDNFIQ